MIDYDKDTSDSLDDERNDTKINPEKYINNTVIKMEDALASNDPEKVFTYYALVEHLQDLADALKMLSTEEIKELETISNSLESADKVKMFQTANSKAKKLLKAIFQNGKIDIKLSC